MGYIVDVVKVECLFLAMLFDAANLWQLQQAACGTVHQLAILAHLMVRAPLQCNQA